MAPVAGPVSMAACRCSTARRRPPAPRAAPGGVGEEQQEDGGDRAVLHVCRTTRLPDPADPDRVLFVDLDVICGPLSDTARSATVRPTSSPSAQAASYAAR